MDKANAWLKEHGQMLEEDIIEVSVRRGRPRMTKRARPGLSRSRGRVVACPREGPRKYSSLSIETAMALSSLYLNPAIHAATGSSSEQSHSVCPSKSSSANLHPQEFASTSRLTSMLLSL